VIVALIDISGVSPDAMNIADMMDGILERVINTYASYSMPLPSRRYWATGQSAIDCEQLTVTLVQGYLGPPGSQESMPQKCNMPRTVVVLITVARQIPTVGAGGRPPAATAIEDASRISAIDSWILLQSINELDMWDESLGFSIGTIGTLELPPPEGGFQLVTLQLTMAVP
jgi:hypothetical protein